MLCFFIVHVYMAFTGKPASESYVWAMINGYDEVEVDDCPVARRGSGNRHRAFGRRLNV